MLITLFKLFQLKEEIMEKQIENIQKKYLVQESIYIENDLN